MPTDRLFCSECGTASEADAVFCESCGHRLADTSEVTGAATDQTPAPKRRRLSPKVVALLAAGVLGGGALVFGAPVRSLLGSIGGSAKSPPDTLQRVQAAPDAQLDDRPTSERALPLAVAEPVSPETEDTEPASPRIQPQTVRQPTLPEPGGRPSDPLPGPPKPFPEDFLGPPPGTAGVPAEAPVIRSEGPATLPARLAGSIPAGSVLLLKSVDQVCTDKTREGAKFRAVLQQSVNGSNGAAIPSGSVVMFVVDRLKRATAPNEKPEFSIAAESITLNGTHAPLTATVAAVAIKQKSRGLLGALAGAATVIAVTKAAGGDTKQTVAGGVAGGAAGAIIGSQLKSGDGCIEKNAAIQITLGADLTIRTM